MGGAALRQLPRWGGTRMGWYRGEQAECRAVGDRDVAGSAECAVAPCCTAPAPPPALTHHLLVRIHFIIVMIRCSAPRHTPDPHVSCPRYHQMRRCPECHPGGNPGANLKSISHRCHPILVAFCMGVVERGGDTGKAWEDSSQTMYKLNGLMKSISPQNCQLIVYY